MTQRLLTGESRTSVVINAAKYECVQMWPDNQLSVNEHIYLFGASGDGQIRPIGRDEWGVWIE